MRLCDRFNNSSHHISSSMFGRSIAEPLSKIKIMKEEEEERWAASSGLHSEPWRAFAVSWWRWSLQLWHDEQGNWGAYEGYSSWGQRHGYQNTLSAPRKLGSRSGASGWSPPAGRLRSGEELSQRLWIAGMLIIIQLNVMIYHGFVGMWN